MMKCRYLANKQGSASVLVIMVMLLLVVFGILAFVSGGSSLRLAEKNAQTVKDYYLLDKQGEIAVSQISALLKAPAPGEDLAEQLRTATGVQTVAVEAQPGGAPAVTLTIENPALKSGATLKIKLQTDPGAEGDQGSEVTEWKLVYKPFVYEEPVNLWEGVN